MDEQRQWHRLFGMSLTDFFAGLPVTVEVEKDLSLKQQLLDVVVVRKGAEPLPCRLPDGFEDLAEHNLISFKSHQEALDGWALTELLGHYVNYRKQVSPSVDDLLPENIFRLFAVTVRFPQGLHRLWPLEEVQEGVCRVRSFGPEVRVVVVHQLPQQEHNALLHLFSARAEQVRYGSREYRPRSRETSSFLFQLFTRYQVEGTPMPFTVEEFNREGYRLMSKDPEIVKLWLQDREFVDQFLMKLPLEKRLEGLPVEKRLEGLPVEKRLEGLQVEELLAALTPEMREILRQRLQADDKTDQS